MWVKNPDQINMLNIILHRALEQNDKTQICAVFLLKPYDFGGLNMHN